jgi:hypothetical protein
MASSDPACPQEILLGKVIPDQEHCSGMLLNFHPSFSFLRVILFVPHDGAPDLLVLQSPVRRRR